MRTEITAGTEPGTRKYILRRVLSPQLFYRTGNTRNFLYDKIKSLSPQIRFDRVSGLEA